MRSQYLLPLAFQGNFISYTWLVAPVTFPTLNPIILDGREFIPSFKSYQSVVTGQPVEFGYIELPRACVSEDGSTSRLTESIDLSAEYPQLPWRVFGSGTYQSPERAWKTVFQRFLEGFMFTPIVGGSGNTSIVPDDPAYVLDSDLLFDNEGLAFQDIDWVTSIFPLISTEIPIPKTVSLSPRETNQPYVTGFLLRDVSNPTGIPDIIRFVKMGTAPVPAGAVLEFNLTVDDAVNSSNVIIRLARP